METSSSLGYLIPLWLFFAVALGQLGLALRAFSVERREGLAPSTRRLAAAAAVFLLVTGVVGWSTLAVTRAHRSKTDSSVATKAPQLDEKQKKELDDKKAELAELQKKETALKDRIAELEGRAALEALRSLTSGPDLLWPLTIAALLVLFGFASLLLLGDFTTLLPSRWFRPRVVGAGAAAAQETSAHAMDVLIAATKEGRWEDGQAAAAKVRDDLLDPIEELDLLFLRAYCAVQLAAQASGTQRREKLAPALKDLTALLDRAPNLGAAEYLLALARGLDGDYQKSLDGFRRCEPRLARRQLPFAQNQSVCLLSLAEARLGENDPDGANRLFDEAARLGVLAGHKPILLVENRLIHVRKSLAASRFDEAREGIELMRHVEGLDAEQQTAAGVICDAFSIVIAFREGKDERTLGDVRAFLDRIRPGELPPVDEHTADEYLEAAVDKKKLEFPVELYRGFHFLEAVVSMRLAAARGRAVTPDEATVLAQPLLRALQYEPRQREVLAALGGLHYWCLPGRRPKAMEWLESALAMGSKSAIARRLLQRARLIEAERRDLLERFMGASARFLGDPTVASQVRKALIEELGRFQDFQPLLVELEQTVDVSPQSPTLQSLRERAHYVESLAGDALRRRDASGTERIAELRREYLRLVESLDTASTRLGELDRRVMEEVGRSVLS